MNEEFTDRTEEMLEETRTTLQDQAQKLSRQAKDAAQTVDNYVRENPWVALAVAAGIGLVLGLLQSGGRRRDSED